MIAKKRYLKFVLTAIVVFIIVILIDQSRYNKLNIYLKNNSFVISPVKMKILIDNKMVIEKEVFNDSISISSNSFSLRLLKDRKYNIKLIIDKELVSYDTIFLLEKDMYAFATFNYAILNKTEKYLEYEKKIFNLKYPDKLFITDTVEVTTPKSVSLYLTQEEPVHK